MSEDQITQRIIGCAVQVHKALGSGLLESAYEECLYYELSKTDWEVEKQKPIPLVYEEVRLECGYRADLIVNHKVIVEIKSVEALNDVHMAQILTYLKLVDCRVGLLMNFNVVKLTNGVQRIVNQYENWHGVTKEFYIKLKKIVNLSVILCGKLCG